MVRAGIDAVVVGQVTPNPDGSYNALINLLTLAAHRVLYLLRTRQSEQAVAALCWSYRQ